MAGIRTPQPITKLEQDLPECYKQFMEIAMKLEAHYRDMQDMEFTIENGKLFSCRQETEREQHRLHCRLPVIL